MLTIVDDNFAFLGVEPEHKFIVHRFKVVIESQYYREFMLLLAENFKAYDCRGWLLNDQVNSATDLEDVDWTRINWEPLMLRANWKFWAVVVTGKRRADIHMKTHMEWAKTKGVTGKLFDTVETASQWLKTQILVSEQR